MPPSEMESPPATLTSSGEKRPSVAESPASEKSHQPFKQRTVSLPLFIGTVVALILTALALGLGLGLGIKRTTLLIVHQPSTSAFNYSSTYGIPDNLPVVDSTKLLNQTELDGQTGFVVSSTPQIRRYTLNITQALAAPDGFQRPMILINGQFPGPLVECNSGDILRVTVNNLMANWSTAMHWHGIDQKNTTWNDGVSGISQCGIPSGQSYTYEFNTTEQRGTYWYHSHLSTQYTDGMFGPLIIHDPTEMVPAVAAEKIIFMGDWYHTYSSVLLKEFMGPTSYWSNLSGTEPLPDTLLLNGRNKYNCSVVSNTYPTPNATCSNGSLYTTKVKSGNSYRLRLINHSTFFSFWFSIDNHMVSIVEIDGTEVVPIPSRGVYVNIGQRYSIVVTANQTAGNYQMRASYVQTCFLPFNNYYSNGLNSTNSQATGILSYDDIAVTTATIGVAGNTTNPWGAAQNANNNLIYEGCNDMPFDAAVPMRQEAAYEVSPNNLHYIFWAFNQIDQIDRITVNKTSWGPLDNNATVFQALDADYSLAKPFSGTNVFPLSQQVLYNDGTGAAQLVINSIDTMEHPWHMHGHNFQIVGWGDGQYGVGNTTWNLANPLRRDTITVPSFGHVVLRWKTDNPGIWALHCHVAWHMEFAERGADLQKLMKGMDKGVYEQLEGFCDAA